jgi:hypothetical protein
MGERGAALSSREEVPGKARWLLPDRGLLLDVKAEVAEAGETWKG